MALPRKEKLQANFQLTIEGFPFELSNNHYLGDVQLFPLANGNLVACYNYLKGMDRLALIQIWNTSGPNPILITTFETYQVGSIVSISENSFATCFDYDGIAIWDCTTGEKKADIPRRGQLFKLSNGLFVKLSRWGFIELFDFNKSLTEPLAILKEDSYSSSQNVRSLIEMPDGRIAALVETPEIKIWDLNKADLAVSLNTFKAYSGQLHFLHSGYFVRNDDSYTGKIDILNSHDGKCIGSYGLRPYSLKSLFFKPETGYYPNNITILPNGNIFAVYKSADFQCIGVLDTTNIEKCKWLWRKETSKAKLRKDNGKNKIVDHCLLPSGHIVLGHLWGKVTIVDTHSGKMEILASPEQKSDSPTSPTSKRCFTVLTDGRLVYCESGVLHFFDLACVRDYFKKISQAMESSTKLFSPLLNIISGYAGYPNKLFSKPLVSSIPNGQVKEGRPDLNFF